MSKSRTINPSLYVVNRYTQLADLRNLSPEVKTVRFPKEYAPTLDQIKVLPETVTVIEAGKHSSAFFLLDREILIKIFDENTGRYEVPHHTGLKRGAEAQLQQPATKRPRVEAQAQEVSAVSLPLPQPTAQAVFNLAFEEKFDLIDTPARMRIAELEKTVAALKKQNDELIGHYSRFKDAAVDRINVLTGEVRKMRAILNPPATAPALTPTQTSTSTSTPAPSYAPIRTFPRR